MKISDLDPDPTISLFWIRILEDKSFGSFRIRIRNTVNNIPSLQMRNFVWSPGFPLVASELLL